jgi:hypothetical protein
MSLGRTCSRESGRGLYEVRTRINRKPASLGDFAFVEQRRFQYDLENATVNLVNNASHYLYVRYDNVECTAFERSQIHHHVNLTGASRNRELGLDAFSNAEVVAVRKPRNTTYTYVRSLKRSRCSGDVRGGHAYRIETVGNGLLTKKRNIVHGRFRPQTSVVDDFTQILRHYYRESTGRCVFAQVTAETVAAVGN